MRVWQLRRWRRRVPCSLSLTSEEYDRPIPFLHDMHGLELFASL